VWYRFTPAVTAQYEFSLCTNTATTVYDTLIGIYSGACGGAFTRVSCNDNSTACGGNDADLHFRSVLTLPLTNGVEYHVVVWEAGNFDYIPGETLLQLRVMRYLPPSATTLSASSLTSTGALLAASVTPNAATSYAWFQYGLTTNYGATTTPANLGAGSNPVTLQSAIIGLTPGALHHFRIVATNIFGSSLGTNLTLQWSSNPPNFTAFFPTNSSYSLRFVGQPVQVYAVQSSTNLLNWIHLGFPTHLGSGLFELTVPGGAPKDFFRIAAP
jgi:hypothetical protein